MRHVLITGTCGFIGANFVRLLAKERPDWVLVSLDKLTYAGNIKNLDPIRGHSRHTFVKGDICDSELISNLIRQFSIDTIINLAAESHVDRSIKTPDLFTITNVFGTQTLLDVARKKAIRRFVQVSTDEVYGSLGDTGQFSENSPIQPSSPYSASKAAADLLTLAYARTYQMDIIVTRCSNNYGPYQHPEKLIPRLTINAINNRRLPLYGSGKNVRDWIHVEDHCRGLLTALEKGVSGQVYNFGGNEEYTNIDIAKKILVVLDKAESLIEFVEDRAGHDWRCAVDTTKARTELGWEKKHSFKTGLHQTIRWYQSHREWWMPSAESA